MIRLLGTRMALGTSLWPWLCDHSCPAFLNAETMDDPSPVKFCYGPRDFNFSCKPWEEYENFKPARFDEELQKYWDAAMEKGLFRYKLDKMESRVIPGKFGLVAQLNERRFTHRRPPEPMQKVIMPFDHSKFNFTKIPSKEVLFEICPEHRESESRSPHLLIVNVSPVDYGNSLLVPNAQDCLPQVLTEEGLQLALEVALISSNRGFHVGFNSPCAFASVNHLHFHMWYFRYPSFLEKVSVQPVCDGVFETVNYPARQLVFECHQDSDVSCVAKKVFTATSYLAKNDVGHNLRIVRTQPGGTRGNTDLDKSVLRVFLWPRQNVSHNEPYYKGSTLGDCNRPIAVVEFAGQLMMDTREAFESHTEEMFTANVQRSTLPDTEFELHKNNIKQLLQS